MNDQPAASLRHSGGSGPPLLLIHGYGADRLTFTGNQAALSAVADVWAVDLPGHGGASAAVATTLAAFADAVMAALERGPSGPLHLIGHSLGGAVALEIAARWPERIRSMTLLGPVGLGARLDRSFLEGYPELAEAAAAELLLRRLVDRPRLVNRMMVGYVLESLAAPGRRQSLRALAAVMPSLAEAARARARDLAASTIPRLLIWGEADQINVLDAETLASFGGQRLILPEVGHLPHVEAAIEVNKVMAAFVAGT